MDFADWLELGLRSKWVATYCGTHDGPPIPEWLRALVDDDELDDTCLPTLAVLVENP
jgi:hypothetical protein